MPFSSLRRQLKNMTLYTVAQAKVRNATSNDVTFPPNKQLAEISRLTNNPVYITEIMNILWKRLNDDKKKNWRHVLKSLTLLEHMLKNGSVTIVEMCMENVYMIKMLRTYQSAESSFDSGTLIRSKAEAIYKLLHEPELLAMERESAAQKRRLAAAKFEAVQNAQKRLQQGPVTSTPYVKKQQSTVKKHPDDRQPSFIASTGMDHSAALVQDSLVKPNFSPIVNANTMKQKFVDVDLSAFDQI